jgi:uncharacterized protein (TIGR02391 family)
MLEWLLEVNAVLREIRRKASDALARLEAGDEAAAKLVNGYLKTDYQALYRLWEREEFKTTELRDVGRHIGFGDPHDYHDIIERDIAAIQIHAEQHAREASPKTSKIGFEDLLHPVIYQHAFQHYLNGHYRDAVLNSIVAIFDLIRERTGLDLDGANLVGEAFSLERARLIFSEIDTDSGKNDQKGFMQIIQGAYLGIRNTKAHSLDHDLDENKAAQYLIFASLIARRVFDAKKI